MNLSSVLLEKLHNGQKSFRGTTITVSKSMKHKKDGKKFLNHIIGYVLMTLILSCAGWTKKNFNCDYLNGVQMKYWTRDQSLFDSRKDEIFYRWLFYFPSSRNVDNSNYSNTLFPLKSED